MQRAEQVEKTLNAMTVGMTKVVLGQVVTRWSEKTYEVGTWGKRAVWVTKAVDMLLEEVA